MANALVLLSPGFEEIEAVTIIDILRRAEIEVVVAGTQAGMITGSHNITLKPDNFYLDTVVENFDILILPGGQPGTNNLLTNEHVLQWLQQRNRDKGLMAAICAAPLVFHKAGILNNISVTSYPSEEKVFSSSNYKNDRVVRDAHVITSRGVGTAIDFSLKLVEILQSNEIAGDIRKKILA